MGQLKSKIDSFYVVSRMNLKRTRPVAHILKLFDIFTPPAHQKDPELCSSLSLSLCHYLRGGCVVSGDAFILLFCFFYYYYYYFVLFYFIIWDALHEKSSVQLIKKLNCRMDAAVSIISLPLTSLPHHRVSLVDVAHYKECPLCINSTHFPGCHDLQLLRKGTKSGKDK